MEMEQNLEKDILIAAKSVVSYPRILFSTIFLYSYYASFPIRIKIKLNLEKILSHYYTDSNFISFLFGIFRFFKAFFVSIYKNPVKT